MTKKASKSKKKLPEWFRLGKFALPLPLLNLWGRGEMY